MELNKVPIALQGFLGKKVKYSVQIFENSAMKKTKFLVENSVKNGLIPQKFQAYFGQPKNSIFVAKTQFKKKKQNSKHSDFQKCACLQK